MNNFIKNIAQFIVFFIPFFLGLFIVWSLVPELRFSSNIRFVKEQTSSLRSQEVQHVKNIDILFIGSSLCYRGFDVRIFNSFGYNTFNLGTSSQTPIQTKYLLKQYLNKIKPKLVIYAIDPFVTSSKNGVESATELISNHYLSGKLNIDMLFEVNDLKLYNTYLYIFLNETRLPKNNEIIDNDQQYIKGGFVERKIAYYKHFTPPILFHIFDKNQLKALNEIKEIFEESKQKFFFVYPPITSNRYKTIKNNEKFISNIENFGALYNFNNNQMLDDSLHYYDDVHLNQYGVEIYNREFLKMLKPKMDSLLR
ncbi:MAG: hypothetical protein RLZZ628_1849 [Bacteroidota bacterium]|jgi:hypothetical protein